MSLECIGNKTKYYVERNVSSANPTKIIIKARPNQNQNQQQDTTFIENMSTSKIISRNNENKLHLPTSREPPPLAPISSLISNATCGLRKSNIVSNVGNKNNSGSSINNNNSSIVANRNSSGNGSSSKIDISVGAAFVLTKGLNESCGSPDGGNSNSSVSTNYTNTTLDSGATSDNSSSITKFKFDFDELATSRTSGVLAATPCSSSSPASSSSSTSIVSVSSTSTTSAEQHSINNDGELFVNFYYIIVRGQIFESTTMMGRSWFTSWVESYIFQYLYVYEEFLSIGAR